LVIKALDPYWIRIRIRIGIQPKMLDPDPDEMNADLQHKLKLILIVGRSLPLFTRYWFGLTVLFTLVARFGLLSARWLVLAWDPFIHE
jgi:hypothetical protein